jgi:ferritin-like metal-binding protein YciE
MHDKGATAWIRPVEARRCLERGRMPPVARPSQRRCAMPAPDSLEEIYGDEMKDLWSANDQMVRAVRTMAEKAHDPKLKDMLQTSISGIQAHADTLKTLLSDADEEVEKEHCKGMEGLVKEALKHTVKEAPEDGELLDIAIIAQYQRMSHYGIAGFGSAAAYAGALGKKDHAAKLKANVGEIYKSDEYASKLGEKTAKAAEKK